MPQISIIVPVFNAEMYLERCIKSILEQEFQDYELILVNDGSTDSSYEILETYKSKDDRIIVLHQSNQGVSAARNLGIKTAKGKYIGFVDADDTIDRGMYQSLFSAIESEQADMVICNWKSIYTEQNYSLDATEQAKDVRVFNKREILNKIFEQNERWLIITVWNKLFKTEIIKNIFFDLEISYGEDTWFAFQTLLKVQNIVVLKESLYNYYIYLGTASHGGICGRKKIDHVQIYKNISLVLKTEGYKELADNVYGFYIDYVLREINENEEDKIYCKLLKNIFRKEWYNILVCSKINFKLKVCYMIRMVKM